MRRSDLQGDCLADCGTGQGDDTGAAAEDAGHFTDVGGGSGEDELFRRAAGRPVIEAEGETVRSGGWEGVATQRNNKDAGERVVALFNDALGVANYRDAKKREGEEEFLHDDPCSVMAAEQL